jgi:hypothetical protein
VAFVFPGAGVNASGEADGASTLAGGALRVVLPTGALTGAATVAGAATRWENVTDVLTGSSDIAGQADMIAKGAGDLTGASDVTGDLSTFIVPGARLLPGQKPKLTRHRVSIAIGPDIDSISEQFVFPKTQAVAALGEADGDSLLLGSPALLTVATGEADGAGIRVALPTGEADGAGTLAGTGISLTVARGDLAGMGDAVGLATRKVWATGTLTGAGSTAIGVATTRIFAPAWGNSSLTGDAQASYLVEASTVSQALLEGLGGYVLVDDAETFAGGSAASATQGAYLKTVAADCIATSDASGVGDVLLDCTGEADGACNAQADTQVAFDVGGLVLAGDGFDLDGNPQASTTVAAAQATMHVAAGASGWSNLGGSAPTPVPAAGTLIGSSTVLFLEAVICATEGFQGVSDTEASAELKMTTQALSVNLSYAVGDRQLWSSEDSGDSVWR